MPFTRTGRKRHSTVGQHFAVPGQRSTADLFKPEKAQSQVPRVWEFDRASLALLREVLERHGWPVETPQPADALLAAQVAGELDCSALVEKYGAEQLRTIGWIALPEFDSHEGTAAFHVERADGVLHLLPKGARPPTLRQQPVRLKCLQFPFAGPQEDFHASVEFWVLFGGAKGGSKSASFVSDAARYCERARYKAWVFRTGLDDLRELIDRAKRLYGTSGNPEDGLGATWKEAGKTFTFPSGATVKFHWMEDVTSTDIVQGQEPTRIYFDEVAQNPYRKALEKASSEIRSPEKDFVVGMRESANPIGPGVPALKKFYIEPCGVRGGRFAETVTVGGVKLEIVRRFIPSKISDNPVYRNDVQYLARLARLPEGMRKVLLDGDWTAAEGSYYDQLERTKHLVPVRPIPPWASLRAGFDWGYAHRWALVAGFRNELGQIEVVETLWGRGMGNVAIAARWAAWLADPDLWEDRQPRRFSLISASPGCFAKKAAAEVGALTAAEEFALAGFPLVPGDEGPLSRGRKGNLLRRWLAWKGDPGMAEGDREPLLVFMDTPGNRILFAQLGAIVPDPDQKGKEPEPLKVDYDPDDFEMDGGERMNFSGDDGQDALWFLIDGERETPAEVPAAAQPKRTSYDHEFDEVMRRREVGAGSFNVNYH